MGKKALLRAGKIRVDWIVDGWEWKGRWIEGGGGKGECMREIRRTLLGWKDMVLVGRN